MMNALIINPEKPDDLELAQAILERLNIPFTRVLSEEEEDAALASLIEEAKDDLLNEEEKEAFLAKLRTE